MESYDYDESLEEECCEGQGPKDRLYYEVQRMCLFDNVFMNHVFQEAPDVAEKVLHILMGREDFKVVKVNIEHKVPNFMGLEPRLDVECEDEKGNLFDIEVQNEVEVKEIVKRSRYYSALETARLLPKGSDSYTRLKDSVVIFILRTWLEPGDDRPIWHVERTIREKENRSYLDGEQILLVNGEYLNDKDPVGKLMCDFTCSKPSQMHYNWLKDKVSEVKTSRRNIMNLTKEERLKREKLVHDTTFGNAKKFLLLGTKMELVKEALNLSEEDIKKLKAEFPSA